MAQPHLDPLTAVDAAFVLREDAGRTHTHVGSVALLEGPVPRWEDVLEHVRCRLHLVPRYRQKLVRPPGRFGRPRWVDDPSFNLEYHLRRAALPAPGDARRLTALVSRIISQRIDRTKPLWELLVVEGLADDRWAIIAKTHHALVDGVGSIDLLSILFDATDEVGDPDEPPTWLPRPEPTAAQLAAAQLGSAARQLTDLPFKALSAATRPNEVVDGAKEALTGVADAVRAGLRPAPDSPLNAPIGPHRRVAFATARLDDLRRVKDVFGGTVNDVVLACVAGGIRALYHHRGQPVGQAELRACVPVSTRQGDHGEGHRITPVLAPMPVHLADPLERLRAVNAAMAHVKDRQRALSAEAIVGMEDFAPPTILAQASRLNLSARLYNVLVTNVPGPQVPLFFLGQRLRTFYPLPYLGGDRALAVAAMSYDGEVAFGVLGDRDALPDVDVVSQGLRAALHELVALAAGRPTTLKV
ncbi:wax ester/triacylglycerol synthase family O-acyltransferase [Conexibacter sp. SYSU D00693]|uniref:WS/DGAT/MGAT family O-acyltransferase n=1 Tax=Conexibacter sp. SYSU D00693 TaxID=2812560 RepID=UPI00196B0403|nr:wax ester/triacylglycerol synthase family O-acyltransferase [Conexibacter sp. SYSU D00693]